MSKIKVSDFYYGAVLSMLFNNHINPALVESDENRQVYDLTTDIGECMIYIKYRADKQNTKKQDYNSWQFILTDNDIVELKNYIQNNYSIYLILTCGVSSLSESEVAVLDKDQIEQVLNLDKSSISISRKKSERDFRLSVGGGRNSAMHIKSNRFEEIFSNNLFATT